MLKDVKLSLRVSKEEFRAAEDELVIRLGMLQRRALELKIPWIVVFEGWSAAGKGTLINDLILPLDPRGFSVFSTNDTSWQSTLRPFLYPYWGLTPARGRLTVFDRSWYRRLLEQRLADKLPKSELRRATEDITAFERQLAADGCVIVKFFLHISKAEQNERFEKLRSVPFTAWRVTAEDLRQNKRYKDYRRAADEMLADTDMQQAPWTIVEAHQHRFATLKIYRTVIAALERALELAEAKREAPAARRARILATRPGAFILGSLDLTRTVEEAPYRDGLERAQDELRGLEHALYVHRIPLVIAFEGCDAAGKGGNIRRLTQKLDPRGYEVVPIAAPNDVERAHHYLWRFWTQMPKAGHITIFDRSWYGRVLVERVEGFCSLEAWQRAYGEINEMERHLANFGAILVKFWLQIDKTEQLRRFRARENTDYKRWKITAEDWRNRKKWELYQAAAEEMISRTSTPVAPWTVVESNSKFFARLKVLRTVIRAIKKRIG